MAAIAVSFATEKAEGLAGQLAARLPSFIWGELKLLWGVSGEIKYIKEELEIMMAFLRSSEQMQETDDVARAWVKQVRQLAYEIEDCFDEFTLHLSWSSRRSFLALVCHRTRTVGTSHRIATEIQSLKSRVEDVSQRRARYTLTDKAPASTSELSLSGSQRDASLFTLNVEETKIVGFDERQEEIVGYLLQDHDQLGIIVIQGTSGLGKTILARNIYESSKVRDVGFQCRAWITVSTSYQLENLLKDLLRQVLENPNSSDDVEKMKGSEVVEKIKSHLQEKRYLIFFDDIWTIKAWKGLESAIPKNNLKSRIIVTTRVEDVANACCRQPAQPQHHLHKLDQLPFDKSRELFCRRVFPAPDHSCPPNLTVLTDKIVKKCGGLPMVILTMAALLASKPEKTRDEDWKNLLDHLGPELESNPSLEAMKQALTLGFADLNYHLKHCFLYLSIFPADHPISRKCLQRLWTAEGFARERRTMKAEQVAESYFNELVSRSMILPSEIDPYGKVKSFRIHNVMLELIVSKSIEANSVSVLEDESIPTPDDVVRRLSVHYPRAYNNIPEGMSLSRVRTLTMFGNGKKTYPQLNPMNLLRVLDLEGCEYLEDCHLEKMGKVPHLRYLSLTRTQVQVLPKQFSMLRNLETLDARETEIIEIPGWIIKLQQLRYLRGGWRRKPTSVVHRDVKRSVTGNTNLLYRTQIPEGMGSVRSLETLTGVDMQRSKGLAKEIGELIKLRKLGVYSLTTKDGLEFCFSVSKLSGCLRSLSIDFDRSEPWVTLLDDNITQPPLQLQNLELSGALVKLPDWVGLLDKLSKLTLHYTCFGDDTIQLQIIQFLPNLTRFTLGDTAYMGTGLCFGGGFPSLKMLHIHMLHMLKSLTFEAGAMPVLELLHISSCSKLQDIFGSENLSNLKEIRASNDYDNNIVEIGRGLVAEHPNKPKLIEVRGNQQITEVRGNQQIAII